MSYFKKAVCGIIALSMIASLTGCSKDKTNNPEQTNDTPFVVQTADVPETMDSAENVPTYKIGNV
ncbi:MAG: hypothetical protein IIY78_01150, partial [Clostridia bacterium]|nr:hypothetical protein [Clostridia bacterium]